ncbi:MAG: TIGR04255 family protein, partial [Paraclostridium sp.]
NIDTDELLPRNTKSSANDMIKSDCFIITNEDKSEKLIINKFFIQYNIQCDKYKNFSHYRNIFNKVITNLENNTQLYKPLRLSHRKINSCIIKDIAKVYDYFERDYYSNPYLNNTLLLHDDSDELLSWEGRVEFYRDDFKFNITNRTDFGEFDESLASRVIADIKGTVDSELLINNEEYKNLLNAVNEELFNIFKDVITIYFLNQMINEKWDEDIIEGVNSNE